MIIVLKEKKRFIGALLLSGETAVCFAMTLLKSYSREGTEHVRVPVMGSFPSFAI